MRSTDSSVQRSWLSSYLPSMMSRVTEQRCDTYNGAARGTWVATWHLPCEMSSTSSSALATTSRMLKPLREPGVRSFQWTLRASSPSEMRSWRRSPTWSFTRRRRSTSISRKSCQWRCVDVNVLGSQNVLRVALDRGGQSVIGISTDKASPPIRNTYGMSKGLMERMYSSMDRKSETAVTCVRYGNVDLVHGLGPSGVEERRTKSRA